MALGKMVGLLLIALLALHGSIGSAVAADRVQRCHSLSALYHINLPKGAKPDRMMTDATAECAAHPTGAIVFLEKGLRQAGIAIPPG